MAVPVPEDDFWFIYRMLQRLHQPYTHEEAIEILGAERESWVRLQRVVEDLGLTDTADQHGTPPADEASPPS